MHKRILTALALAGLLAGTPAAATPMTEALRHRPLAIRVASEEGVPHLADALLSYCAQEGFNSRQSYRAGGLWAIGACSIQRFEYPGYTVSQLQQMETNLRLQVREIRDRWQGDVLSTLAYVFWPGWKHTSRGVGGYRSRQHYQREIEKKLMFLGAWQRGGKR